MARATQDLIGFFSQLRPQAWTGMSSSVYFGE
jgi:hypothetical protein